MNEIDIAKIDLNLLKALKVLLDEQHVGRSAARMNVSQSAMSHTLSRLRTTFNDPLFIRKSTGLEPTKRAIELDTDLTELLAEISQFFSTQELDPSNISTHFRIQTHDFIASELLPSKLDYIKSIAPKIKFELQLIHDEYYDAASRGDIDLIIGAGLSAPNNFMQRKMQAEKVVCLLDRKNPVLKNWKANTIFKCPHIKLSLLPEKEDPVSKFGQTHNLPKRNYSFYTDSLQMQPPLISGTQNIAFLPEIFAIQASKYHKLKVMDCPFELPPIVIKGLWHHRNQHDPAHQWIRNIIISPLPS